MGDLQNKNTMSAGQLWFRSIVALLVMIVLIFVSAGTLRYWQGWIVTGFYIAISIFALKGFSDKKDLLQERIKPGPGVKWWDKIIFRIFVPLTTITMIFSAMDCGRFHFSPKLPTIVYVISFVVMVGSYSFIMWAMRVNNFFSSRVRIQSDRGQYVVSEGPYKFVRHPGYLGVLFWQPSMALMMGSVWGLVPAGLAVLTIVVRTYLEDKMLQKELPGYSEYAQKVRYRLVWGVW
jgi:protein-S-isoprenylcysteine O-methyltransferase Ste14